MAQTLAKREINNWLAREYTLTLVMAWFVKIFKCRQYVPTTIIDELTWCGTYSYEVVCLTPRVNLLILIDWDVDWI